MKNKTQPEKFGTMSRKKIKPIFQVQTTPKSKFSAKISGTEFSSYEEILLKECGYFSLYALHAVNCILNSKIRKSYNEHDLKG